MSGRADVTSPFVAHARRIVVENIVRCSDACKDGAHDIDHMGSSNRVLTLAALAAYEGPP